MTPEERSEWLQWRAKGIGASDVAGILGISPWASPFSVWAAKVSDADDAADDLESEAIEAGVMLEPAVAPWFERRNPGLYVGGIQRRVEHPEYPWARATLDGLVFDHATAQYPRDTVHHEPLGGLEIKVTSAAIAEWEDEIPAMYQAQAQWQMWVAGTSHTWFAVVHVRYGAKLRQYELARDDDEIEFIVGRVQAFWDTYVVPRKAPPVDGHDATTDALKARDPAESAGVLLSDEAVAAWLRSLQLAEEIKFLEEERAKSLNRLRAELGDHTVGYIPDEHNGGLARVVTWREHDQTRLDVKALRARLPRTAARFDRSSPVRVLRTNNPPKPRKGRKQES